MDRAATSSPLSPMQLGVCELLGLGHTYVELADDLGVSVDMIREHAKLAAAKIPGDLPAQARCIAWARGATEDVLKGLSLRYEVTMKVRRMDANHPLCGEISPT